MLSPESECCKDGGNRRQQFDTQNEDSAIRSTSVVKRGEEEVKNNEHTRVYATGEPAVRPAGDEKRRSSLKSRPELAPPTGWGRRRGLTGSAPPELALGQASSIKDADFPPTSVFRRSFSAVHALWAPCPPRDGEDRAPSPAKSPTGSPTGARSELRIRVGPPTWPVVRRPRGDCPTLAPANCACTADSRAPGCNAARSWDSARLVLNCDGWELLPSPTSTVERDAADAGLEDLAGSRAPAATSLVARSAMLESSATRICASCKDVVYTFRKSPRWSEVSPPTFCILLIMRKSLCAARSSRLR